MVVNPYATPNLFNIPTSGSRMAGIPQLSGIDESTIYGKNSPGYGSTQSAGSAGGYSPDYAGAATGALGLAANAYGMSQQRFNFSNIAPQQQDDNSAPTYNAGQLYNEASGSHPKGAQAGEILGGVGQGAAAGASFGPVGAAIGGVIGGAASIIGGSSRKKAEEEQKKKALAQASLAQTQYNTADVSYRNHQNELYNYYNQNNAAGREYNVQKSRF